MYMYIVYTCIPVVLTHHDVYIGLQPNVFGSKYIIPHLLTVAGYY